ncbi:MAG: alpha/beta fold hydrolase [Rhodocyclaceae bacterium]|jgi:non-heme chloroperoxidase|nr:alpha/beta fold hydrolase [Rhodocyclaceae bacterium]MCA3088419.1 alpha/beta fold hydrolase [Rhodocyclaceae bacterium]MCA3094319.1 alpha/beta fold hydrolase [Rhodocyclaceae bacterium]MCA3096663.1 alpha/beta fold hydrolase [Rhodocyclaceae bacterium]MCA3103665.1 alpha/beta fold hydrolase [Rhodocyclaceae bacterium]
MVTGTDFTLPPGTVRGTFEAPDGIGLSFLQSGVRSARPSFLLLPGWSMPAWIWAGQFGPLSADRAVFALDPRGQGESDRPTEGYDIRTRARDLHAFAASIAPVVVVGWSLAALETLHAIHQFGSMPFAGVVLVDSSVGEEPAPPAGSPFIDALQADRESALDGFVRAVFASGRPEAEMRALVDGALRMPLAASIALFPRDIPREYWREVVRSIELPLLYAVSPQFQEQAWNLRLQRPRTQVEVFHRSGHALFADEPDRFNRLLIHFARKLGGPPA